MAKFYPSIYEVTAFNSEGSEIERSKPDKYIALSDDTDREIQFMEIAYARGPEVSRYEVRSMRPKEIQQIIKTGKKAEAAKRRRDFSYEVEKRILGKLGIDIPSVIGAMALLDNRPNPEAQLTI